MTKQRLQMFLNALESKDLDLVFLRKQYILLKKELDVLLA